MFRFATFISLNSQSIDVDFYLERSALDVDTSSATRQRALDANQNVSMAFLFVFLRLMAIAQQVTQFAVIALMRIVPHLLAHYVNLRTTSTVFIIYLFIVLVRNTVQLTNCIFHPQTLTCWIPMKSLMFSET